MTKNFYETNATYIETGGADAGAANVSAMPSANELLNSKAYSSKTKAKNKMHELQQLGVSLTKLSKEQLATITMSEELRDQIIATKNINSNSALRRQCQYLGRLMRDIDTTLIEEGIARLNGKSVVAKKIFHQLEQWRDKLIADDENINKFKTQYPHADVTALRNLVRMVRKEIDNDSNRNYRKLFKLIREVIEGATSL